MLQKRVNKFWRERKKERIIVAFWFIFQSNFSVHSQILSYSSQHIFQKRFINKTLPNKKKHNVVILFSPVILRLQPV